MYVFTSLEKGIFRVVPRCLALRQAADDGKPHVVLVDMLKAMHKANQTMKQTVGSECPVFQDRS